MPVKLYDKTVKNAAPQDRRYEIADSLQPGLRLVVQPSGAKSWAYRYEREDRKGVKVTLGRAAGPGALTLQQARNAANDARRLRSTGGDPADRRRAERQAEAVRIEVEEREARRKDDAVENVLARFYKDHVEALKSAHDVKRLLNKELKGWKRRRVDDISRADAIKLIDTIKARGAGTTANRTRANARKFFNWCIAKGLIEANPFALTQPVKAEIARDRILNDDELRLLSMAITRLDWPWRQYFTLAMMTGQRREECAGMRWSEIDLLADNPVWVLPSSRTKNSREHAVPLSPQVAALLKGIDRVQTSDTANGVERITDSPFVFTTTGKTPISGFSKAKEHLDKAITEVSREEAKTRGGDAVEVAPWRIHDLRRTVASGMARLGIGVAVAEKVMNHVSGTFAGIVGVYQRHDFLAEKRHALNLWADHIAGLTTERESNVVRLKMGEA